MAEKKLTGNQKKLDVNNDGKLTEEDFKTLNAKPKSKPRPPVTNSTNSKTGATRGVDGSLDSNSTNSKTGATRGTGIEDFTSGRQNKMGGGQVMKYKKGGIIYKQGGGVIKANSGGQNIVDSGYTKV